MKKKYYAWVQNKQGATEEVPRASYNKNELKSFIRANYGPGWRVHLLAVDLDGDGQSVLGSPYEIESWTLRS